MLWGITLDPIKIAASALSLSWETRVSTLSPHNGETTPSPTNLQFSRWELSSIDLFKTNIDATTSNTHAAIGVITRNHHRKPMASMAKEIPLSQSVSCLEAHAIFNRISLTYQIRIEDFTVETDCSDICHKVASREIDYSLSAHFTCLIKEIIHQNSRIKLRYVNRKATVVAHSLVRMGIDLISQQVWMGDIPHQLYPFSDLIFSSEIWWWFTQKKNINKSITIITCSCWKSTS